MDHRTRTPPLEASSRPATPTAAAPDEGRYGVEEPTGHGRPLPPPTRVRAGAVRPFDGPLAVGYQALDWYAVPIEERAGALILEAVAAERGWVWGGTYTEHPQLRGQPRGRSAFAQLLIALETQSLIEEVVLPSLEHLGRSLSSQVGLYEVLADTGVRVHLLHPPTTTAAEAIAALSPTSPSTPPATVLSPPPALPARGRHDRGADLSDDSAPAAARRDCPRRLCSSRPRRPRSTGPGRLPATRTHGPRCPRLSALSGDGSASAQTPRAQHGDGEREQ